MRVMARLAGMFAIALFSSTMGIGASPVQVRRVDGQLTDPLAPVPGVKATALVFVSAECPLSNRYAPDLRRIADTFTTRGIRFWLVYPNPTESEAAIRAHLNAFELPLSALRDPDHLLVRLARATVTPEVAVFDPARRLVYHGRIDNRHASLAVTRPIVTEHDLIDALSATLAGRPVARPTTQAVGCFLADFRS